MTQRIIAFCLLLLLSPIMIIVSIVIIISDLKFSPIYNSMRVGQNGVIFYMYKFRTMNSNTPEIATHLLKNPSSYFLPMGGFLRRTSLDELPQLISILKGDMVFIGPRPALFNQDYLIALRAEKGVDKLLPGVTGWAQVNGRDKLSIDDKVALDVEYLYRQSFWFDMKILWMTFLKVMKRDGVSH